MELPGIIEALRRRTNDFRNSELSNIKPLKFDINSIEIALCLAELGHYNNRSIQPSEEYWFKGTYLISNDFNGEWEDISMLYGQLVEKVQSLKYFRK